VSIGIFALASVLSIRSCLKKTPASIRKDPPALGQDTAAVMARVGCSKEQIQAVLDEAKAEHNSAHNQDRIKFAASSGQAGWDKS
jgi:hypothetical protein